VIKATFENLTKEEDYQQTVDFFKVILFRNVGRIVELTRAGDQDKDTSRYNLALSQTFDSLRASRAWIEVRSAGPIVGES
jgi:aminopeptidase 2